MNRLELAVSGLLLLLWLAGTIDVGFLKVPSLDREQPAPVVVVPPCGGGGGPLAPTPYGLVRGRS